MNRRETEAEMAILILKQMRLDQDGRILRHWAHLPPQTHLEHTYVGNSSHNWGTIPVRKTNWKLAEEFLYTQTCGRNFHTSR